MQSIRQNQLQIILHDPRTSDELTSRQRQPPYLSLRLDPPYADAILQSERVSQQVIRQHG